MTQPLASADPARVVAVARSWLGTPYHDQASLRGVGCDCLGLARGVWRDVVGPEPFPILPYSRDWGETGPREVLAEGARRMMIEVSPAEAGPGALVLFCMRPRAIAKHVGILTGPATFLHAYERLGVIEDPRQAGLFHTAFLMPTRADLARWVAHVAEARVPLQGASDHIVSEALYLADPEGNGIEVYADRPVSDWHGESGEIRMSTDPLDLQDLLQSAGGTSWTGFPEGGSVGHVHLQVGDTAEADRFYRDLLGLDIAARYPGASFYGSGGYHHQLAGNVWNSRRAGVRPQGMAGLDAVEIVVRSAADLAAITARVEGAGMESIKTTDGLTLHDPWGTAITLTT